MGYLLLCILCSSFIFIIFKLFEKYKINTLQAIVVNYAVAFGVGVVSHNYPLVFQEIPQKSWFVGALVLSVLFITVFNVMAITAQRNGVSVASVAGKMAIVVPVLFGVFVYQEQLSVLQVVGIGIALIAVYLSTYRGKTDQQSSNLLFPILLFLGSGVIDTALKYIQKMYVSEEELSLFSAVIFLCAGVLGIISLVLKKENFQFKNIGAGVLLGVVNYYSVYYLLKALSTKGLLSATVFTINNVAVVMLTTLLGVLLFREKLSFKNWLGIGFAVLSIFLIIN